MTELERLLSQDDSCLISVASVKRALKQDSKKGNWISVNERMPKERGNIMTNYTTKQYMKYMTTGNVTLEVNKEIEKGAKVVFMIPFLRTDNWGSYTAGYHVLFEKEEKEEEQKSETITEFADRCRECGAKYGKLLNEAESKSNTSELKPCPFCGSDVKLKKWDIRGYSGCFNFGIKCSKCGCVVDYIDSDTIYRSEEEAIRNVVKAWNERKETK